MPGHCGARDDKRFNTLAVGADKWSRAVAEPLRGWSLGLALLIILVAAVSTRTGLLGLPAQFDEFYHLLAARSWNATGQLSILDGIYDRGAVFTHGLALHLRVLGDDSLFSARLFALIFGAAVPVVLFAWVNHHAGWAVAGFAALFAVFWPGGIQEAQTVRFYSLHVLAILVGAVAVYEMFQAVGPRRVVWAVLGLVALALALSVQPAALIGIAAIGLWWALTRALPYIAASPARNWFLGLGIPAAILLLIAAHQVGFLQKAWDFYRWAPAHSEAMRDDILFYHRILLDSYGPFWAAFPLVLALAIWRARGLGVFCAVLFAVAFLTHTFGAFKAPRYVSYVMPFFFTLMALAVVTGAELIYRAVSRWRAGAGWLAGSVAAAVVAAALVTGSFITPTLRLATGTAPLKVDDWSGVAALVDDWDTVPFRITTRELDTIAYLGDYDLLISRSRLSELPPFTQFTLDPRTGRPVVSTPEAVTEVIRCVPDGLIVADPGWWTAVGWQDRLAPTLATPGLRYQTRADDHNFLLRWQSPSPADLTCDLPGR